MRRAPLIALVAGLALATCGTARASTIGISTPILKNYQDIQYTADPGETNRVVVSDTTIGGVLGPVHRTVIFDSGATIRRDSSLGQGVCTLSGHRATCITRHTPLVIMTLADGNDTVDSGTFHYFIAVDAGAGNDSAVAEPHGAVSVNGGPGDDSVHARGPGGFGGLDGGTGDDTLVVDAGAETGTMVASPGADRTLGAGDFFWDYSATSTGVTVTPDGIANDGTPGEGDNVSPNTTDLYGSEGDDDLTAGVRGTFLLGHGGNDVIHGGPQPDCLCGGEGDDVIYAHGGGSDSVQCGEGVDQAFVDPSDRVLSNPFYPPINCETLAVSP